MQGAGEGFHFQGPLDVPGYPPHRMVRIYVPRRARDHDRPLLLMFDGQNVFDDRPSFAGGWHTHLAVERLAQNVSPPVVVGVDHGNERRIAELSPFSFGPHQGRAEGFVQWIRSVLMPELRGRFGVTHDRRAITVGGSSMGGLAALYAHLSMPDTFGGSIAMSPSLFVGRGAIYDWARQQQIPSDARFYLDAGEREPPGMMRGAKAMAELLWERGARHLWFRADKRGAHRETDWRRRLPYALRRHFGASKWRAY